MTHYAKKNQQDAAAHRVGWWRRPHGLRHLVWPAVACLAIAIGDVSGQQSTACKKDGATEKTPKKLKAKKSGDSQPSVTTKTAGTEPQAKPGPKWACTQPNIDLEPLWYGNQIECAFTIRNEGTSDLNIKAAGG